MRRFNLAIYQTPYEKQATIIEFSTLVKHFRTLREIMIQQIERLLWDELWKVFASGFSHAAFIDVTQFMSLSFNCQLENSDSGIISHRAWALIELETD